jgi:hypothetical protein
VDLRRFLGLDAYEWSVALVGSALIVSVAWWIDRNQRLMSKRNVASHSRQQDLPAGFVTGSIRPAALMHRPWPARRSPNLARPSISPRRSAMEAKFSNPPRISKPITDFREAAGPPALSQVCSPMNAPEGPLFRASTRCESRLPCSAVIAM